MAIASGAVSLAYLPWSYCGVAASNPTSLAGTLAHGTRGSVGGPEIEPVGAVQIDDGEPLALADENEHPVLLPAQRQGMGGVIA